MSAELATVPITRSRFDDPRANFCNRQHPDLLIADDLQMRAAQQNEALLFHEATQMSLGFELRIGNAESLSKSNLRALALEFRAVLAAFFDSASDMNAAYDEWVVNSSPLSTDWGCAMRATQRSLTEEWPGCETYIFQVSRVYDLH